MGQQVGDSPVDLSYVPFLDGTIHLMTDAGHHLSDTNSKHNLDHTYRSTGHYLDWTNPLDTSLVQRNTNASITILTAGQDVRVGPR